VEGGLPSPAGGRKAGERVDEDAELAAALEGGSDEVPRKAGVNPGGMVEGGGGGCRDPEGGLGRPPEQVDGGGGAPPRRTAASQERLALTVMSLGWLLSFIEQLELICTTSFDCL
jgi:hypothetical protein